MTFKIRISNIFVMNVLLIVMASALALANFFHPIVKSGFLHYSYVIWGLIAVLRSIGYYKPVYFAITRQTILTVTDEYIDDFISGIRFYWKDIKEIYEKNGYLRIILYKPKEHLQDISNPLKRFIARSFYSFESDSTPFWINMDIVDVHANVLLKLLNDYSIQAENNK